MMDKAERYLAIVATCLVALLCVMFWTAVHARDLGQWENNDPEIRQWFRSLMQPDHPQTPCCGEADGYWCEPLEVKDGQMFCTITDDRDNEKLKRIPVAVGTKVKIPPNKLGNYPGNPTGHNIVFMAPIRWGADIQDFIVYCYVQGSGL